MPNFDELLRDNARFARSSAKDSVPAIPFIPDKQVYILTCIGPRVDPARVFGLRLGDAIVARTVGGRVTPAVLQDLAWIGYLHEVKTPGADWFELAVLDPAATVSVDVEKIVTAPQVSPEIKVSGYSYDIKAGLVTTVVPPRSRQHSGMS